MSSNKMKLSKIDTLIMGCTHYPIIQGVIKKEVDNNVKLIDPGKFVAIEVAEYLNKNNLLNKQKRNGDKEFFVTDLTDRFAKIAEMFLGEEIKGRISKVSLNS